jgi:hypothetical protein
LSGVFVGIFFGEDATMLKIAARPYLDEMVAFVVKDHLRDQFSTWAGIRELGAFRVAICRTKSITLERGHRRSSLSRWVPVRVRQLR